VRVFRAGPGYLRLKLARWFLAQATALALILLALFGIEIVDLHFLETFLPFSVLWLHLAAMLLFLLEATLSWVMIRLDYRNRWYILTDRCLRIREGLKTVREMTISLANIQHIALRQGPLQRLVGIADVEVRTAGGGSSDHPRHHQGDSASMHIGRLRGIADAEAVRDSIVERWRALRTAATAPERLPAVDPASTLLAAGRALEAEARLLGGRCADSARAGTP